MKNKRSILLAIALLSLCACNNGEHTPTTEVPFDETGVDVVFLAGQSNAEGHTYNDCLYEQIEKGKLSEEKYYYYESEMTTEIAYYCNNGSNRSNGFTEVKLGQGFDYSRFGPEIGMAEAFESAKLNRKIVIIKYALGATNLYSQWKSDSSFAPGTYTNNLYSKFIDFALDSISIIEEAGYIPHVRAFCWMQGEADSLDYTYTANYQEYEENLFLDIENVMSDYIHKDNGENFHVVNALISTYSGWTNRYSINKAKKDNSEKYDNWHIVDTSSLTYGLEPTIVNADQYHFDSLSMIELGNMFGQTIIDNL